TALEAALKLTETTYVRSQPYSAADFLHGPIVAVEEGTPCLLIAPSGKALSSMQEVALRLVERGGELLAISDAREILRLATTPIQMPVVAEPCSPLVAVVAGQLFAYHLARVKGRDPDQPRGLRKVTVTQ